MVIFLFFAVLLLSRHSRPAYRRSFYDFPFEFSIAQKNKSSGEEIARAAVEDIFQKEFPTARPHFLNNPATGKNLELDMYNAELGLAIEYDGRQHTHYVPHFHKSYDHYRYQKSRDSWKTLQCLKNGVRLVRIPYTVPKQGIRGYLLKALAA